MKVQFSKLDVAKRQLETAVDLFFKNGDPVSIHTLACAAQEILETILGKQGIKSMQKELIDLVIDEKKDYVFDKINEPKNFFKHGARDANKTLEFSPELSTYFIWDACELYEKLTKEKIKSFFIFKLWFGIQNREAFSKLDNVLKYHEGLFEENDRIKFYKEASAAYDQL